jgi:hypothetical protein
MINDLRTNGSLFASSNDKAERLKPNPQNLRTSNAVSNQHHMAGLRTKGSCQLTRPHLLRDTVPKTIRIDSVRSLFAIYAANDLRIVQVDCKNAFLHCQSDFEIFTSNNLKDSLTPIILTPYFSSSKRYMASSKHHVYGTYFYQRLL